MEAQKEAILEKSKKTMSVPEMRRLLGLKKTDSYWLVHRNFFQTYIVNGQMWVDIASFEKWYANQVKHKKVNGEEPGADLLGITKEKLSVITRASRFKEYFEIRVFENKKWISKKSFQYFLNAQSVYQVTREPEKEDPAEHGNMETKEYISRQEAAAFAGVTSGTITKWIQMGHFSSAGAGKALRIHRNEFLKWLKEYQEGV